MKKKALIFLPLCFYCILIQSCKKDSTDATNTAATTTSVVAAISSGTWTITSFTQKTETKTADFAGMNFNFTGDGKVAVTGATSANGTWTYSPVAAGYYGAPSSPATLTINIVSGSTFKKLSKTWNIGATSATSLSLNNPEAAEDEHVTFSKK